MGWKRGVCHRSSSQMKSEDQCGSVCPHFFLGDGIGGCECESPGFSLLLAAETKAEWGRSTLMSPGRRNPIILRCTHSSPLTSHCSFYIKQRKKSITLLAHYPTVLPSHCHVALLSYCPSTLLFNFLSYPAILMFYCPIFLLLYCSITILSYHHTAKWYE